MSAQDFLNTLKIRVDKVPYEKNTVFLTRIGYCLSNAKTDEARWRLYHTAMIRIHYTWIQYVDRITA